MKVPRIAGIDLVYAFSVCMVICFSLSVGLTGRENTLSVVNFDLIADTFAALFLLLNGITASLMMARRSYSRKKVQGYLIRKGVLFLGIGIVTSFFWPVQILITLGLLFLIAPLLTQLTGNILKVLYITCLVVVVLLFSFGEARGVSNVPALALRANFIVDYFRYVVVSGYFSILPWSLFFIAGILFGRLDFLNLSIRRSGNLFSWIAIGLGSVTQILGGTFFSSGSLPKSSLIFPFFYSPSFNVISFILIATGLSIILINACLSWREKKKKAKAIHLLQRMGSIQQTLYVNHLVFGIVLILVFGQGRVHTLTAVLGLIIFYLSISVLFTWLWKKQFSLGPIEWVLKVLAGSNEKT